MMTSPSSRARPYHNTNGLEGEELQLAMFKAVTQEQRVLLVFRKEALLTPEDVHRHFPAGTPLTSVRRAMSNLTKRGVLRKTIIRTRGKYNAPVHYWSKVTPE